MPYNVTLQGKSERIKSAVAVVAMHAVLGYALASGKVGDVASGVNEAIKTFDVAPESAPPPPPPEPAPKPDKAEEGAAAPPNIRSKATPVVAPKPIVELPVLSPVLSAPIPDLGYEATIGAAEVPGPGTGAGGVGDGRGSGAGGDGSGGGGIAMRGRLVKGAIGRSDYPRAARKARAEGTVVVWYTVGTDGRARGCEVEQSSGNAALDAATCQLIEKRYRYEPARDARGRPVAYETGWEQRWWLERG